MTKQETINTLVNDFDGSLWENYGKSRIYFNGPEIAESQGLSWSNYNSGNISSASLNGDKVSNSECKRILGGFQWVKVWYDVASGKFYQKGDPGYETTQEMIDQFIADAKEAIA